MSEEDRQESESAAGGEKQGLEGLYEKLNRRVRENLERTGKLTEDTLERALQETREWGRQLREHYGEDVTKVVDYLRRDFREAARQAQAQTRRSLDLDRIGAGVLGFVQRMAKNAGTRLDALAKNLDERLTYKTGEVAGPGTLTCSTCGQALTFDNATRIPPCPKCRGTSFRRSY